jgi:hypothetical protein
MVLIPSCNKVIRDDGYPRKGTILVTIPSKLLARMERRKPCEELELPQDSFNSSRVDAITGMPPYFGFTIDTVPSSAAHSVIGTWARCRLAHRPTTLRSVPDLRHDLGFRRRLPAIYPGLVEEKTNFG